jgi:hypothetical protein
VAARRVGFALGAIMEMRALRDRGRPPVQVCGEQSRATDFGRRRRPGEYSEKYDLIVVDVGERDAWALSSVSASDESLLHSSPHQT